MGIFQNRHFVDSFICHMFGEIVGSHNSHSLKAKVTSKKILKILSKTFLTLTVFVRVVFYNKYTK